MTLEEKLQDRHREGWELGLIEGKLEGKLEAAAKFKAGGLAIDIIAKTLDLPLEEIERL